MVRKMGTIGILASVWLCGTLPPASAVTVVEDFNVDPTMSGNGWAAWDRANTITVDTLAGTANINSIGKGAVSPQFYLFDSTNWTNVEMILTSHATECLEDPSLASWGNGILLQTNLWMYLLGIEVVDLGGGQYQTTIKAWDGYGPYPGLIGSYTLPETTINEHRYNVELNNTSGEFKVYVDAFRGDSPVITGTALTGYHSGQAVYFGDLRGGSPTTYRPNGNGTWSKLTLSTEQLLPGNDLSAVIELSDYGQSLEDVGIRVELRQGGTAVQTERMLLNADGSFMIRDIAPGTYDVAIKACSWLQKVLTGVAINGPVNLGTITLTNGDVDGDNEVTTSDLATVLLNMDQVGD